MLNAKTVPAKTFSAAPMRSVRRRSRTTADGSDEFMNMNNWNALFFMTEAEIIVVVLQYNCSAVEFVVGPQLLE